MVGSNEPRNRAFAKRLQTAIDSHGQAPPQHFGRLAWIAARLSEHGVPSTQEAIRKWIAGEALPRPRSITALATLFQVDEAWLAVGRSAELAPREQKLRNAEVDGIVNVVAGMIQICGANPAFPPKGDQRAEKELIDIYAIIRGAQYAFHIVMATEADGGYRFAVPAEAKDTFVIGVIRTSELAFSLYEIDDEALATGTRKSGFIEIMTPAKPTLKPIKTFAERL